MPTISDEIEQIVRDRAQRLVVEILELEVDEFLQQLRYRRGGVFKGYRNGHAPARSTGVGMGRVTVRGPRVSDVPEDVAPEGFHFEIVSRYQRVSRSTQRLLARLYLGGLSTGDFEPVLRAILGETSPLSPTSVTRLRKEWRQEYETWRKRRLDGHRYLCLWVDGLYLRARQELEKTALLCVLGLRENGERELLAVASGYRESTASWAEVPRDLKERGLGRPLLMIGDGALGICAALREVWPGTGVSAAGTIAPSTSWTSCSSGCGRGCDRRIRVGVAGRRFGGHAPGS